MSEKRKAPEGGTRAAGAGLLGDLMHKVGAMPAPPKKPKPSERNMGEDPFQVRAHALCRAALSSCSLLPVHACACRLISSNPIW